MIEYGALGALMSGSGPSVFGLYRNKKEAQAASTELKLHSEAKDVFIATIFNRRDKNGQNELDINLNEYLPLGCCI